MKVTRYALYVAALSLLVLGGCGRSDSASGSKPKKSRHPTVVLTERLGIQDETAINEIFRLLDSAVFRTHGTSDLNRKEDRAIVRAAKKAQAGQRPSEADVAEMMRNAEKRVAARKQRAAEDEAKGIVHLLPHESLEKAWEILHEARPELDGYEGRKMIADALHEIWSYSNSLYFRRLPYLIPPADFEPPQVDEKYEHFFTMKGYGGDPVFQELLKMKDDDLPSGAVLPLMTLRRVGDTGLKREGYFDLTDDALVKRYGERMLPAVIEYLAHPEKYGEENTGYPPTHILALARDWSDESKAMLQRQAFLSGWDDAYRMLEGPYTPALLEEFKDSPYGAPDRP